MKSKFVGFRAEPALYEAIKGMAARRDMNVSAYARLLCSLELLSQPPLTQEPALMALKEMLSDMDAYSDRPPRQRLSTLQRAVQAIITAQEQLEVAGRWILTVAEGEEALSRATRRREPLDG